MSQAIPSPRSRRTTSSERAKLLRAFDRSGLSAAAFARQRQINYTTFCGWRQGRAAAAGSAGEPKFVEVELATAAGASSGLVVEVGAEIRLRISERWTDFKDRHGHSGRDQVLYLARKTTALSLSELAEEVEMKTDATISMAIKRYTTKLKQNRSERDFVAQAAEMLNVGV